MPQLVAGVAQGYVGEFDFSRLLAACKLQKVKFDSMQLAETAKQSKAGLERLNLATPYLLSEYGTPIRTPEGRYRVKLDWEHIPAEAILDKVYGLDAVISFRGWNIGIDVTTNSEALLEKKRKLNWLKPLWKRIGIDHVAVIHLLILNRELNPGKEVSSNFKLELRNIINSHKQLIELTL